MKVTDYGILFGMFIFFLVFLLGENPKEEITVEEFKPSISVEVKLIDNFELTFYTHTGNRTASGVYPKAGRTVAVDKNVIPLGTMIYVEGYGLYVAEDTGGDIKGKRLDVFVDTKEEAIKLGRKTAKVYLLDDIKENLYNKVEDLDKEITNGTKATD